MEFLPAKFAVRACERQGAVAPTLRAFALLVGSGPLGRYTVRTVVNVGTFTRELAKIRAIGVGTDIGAYLDESVCLALPVWDFVGRMHATIAVHGPAPRMSSKEGYAFLPAMREAAPAIAATLFPADCNLATPSEKPQASRTKRVAA